MANSNLVTKSMRRHKFHNPRPCGDVASVSSSRPGSPSDRVKFLCSHGGKILPRPADGHLKYIGGDTRVISVRRDITFPELMKKLTSMFNGEMILKYQLDPRDLDVLVTVKSDEDIRHMIDECDRHEHRGAPRLRSFLFPATPIVLVNHLGTMDHHSLEQRYMNSINGILVNPPTITNTFRPPETNSAFATRSSLTRNHSSPSLCNPGCSSVTDLTQSHHQQPPQPHLSPKPLLDRHPHKTSGPEHLGRMRSSGVAEYYRQQMDHRRNKGGYVYYQRGSTYEDYYGNCGYDRTSSPPSPDVPSSSPGIRSGR